MSKRQVLADKVQKCVSRLKNRWLNEHQKLCFTTIFLPQNCNVHNQVEKPCNPS